MSVTRNRVSSQYRFLAYSIYYIQSSASARLTGSPGAQASPLGVAGSSRCPPYASATLIAPWEFVDLDVIALPKRAKAHGLNWHHAPILDGRTPDDTPAGYTAGEWFVGRWPAIAPELHAALNRGEGVVVHCKGGLGRAGTVAGLLLAQREPGLSTEEIIQRVRTARPNAIETVVQERYLARVSGAPPPR